MSNISETDYVRWVQRSLNRLVNAQLTVDGYKSDDYRRGVKTLQMLSPTLRHYCDPNGFKNNLWGSVDQPTQDVIIEWNQTMFGYMTWVQKSLTKIGMYANFPTGVLEWFLGNKGGRVQGYANAIFTGFTSLALANIIENMIKFHPYLHGIWHISSAPISKFDLLMLINQKMDLHIVVDRNDNFRCDRSLNSDHFRKATGFIPPSWEEMIAEMTRDNNIYLEDD